MCLVLTLLHYLSSNLKKERIRMCLAWFALEHERPVDIYFKKWRIFNFYGRSDRFCPRAFNYHFQVFIILRDGPCMRTQNSVDDPHQQ